MMIALEVICLYSSWGRSKVILGTSLWSQIDVITRVLSYLSRKISNKVFKWLIIKLTLIVQARVTDVAAVPMVKSNVLQLDDESRYTETMQLVWKYKLNLLIVILLCSPLLVPQIVGGVIPPGLVTEKVSVRHLVLKFAEIPGVLSLTGAPPKTINSWPLAVLGPASTKLSKSRRSYKIKISINT